MRIYLSSKGFKIGEGHFSIKGGNIMWKNIDPGDNMSWSSQYKDFLHVDFIYSMVYSGLRLDMFQYTKVTLKYI
jgi:hypothetical protein